MLGGRVLQAGGAGTAGAGARAAEVGAEATGAAAGAVGAATGAAGTGAGVAPDHRVQRGLLQETRCQPEPEDISPGSVEFNLCACIWL